MPNCNYPAEVQIIEVGVRDGFQSEKKFIPTALKIQIIERLVAAGIRQIQVASFVNPKVVPQMADADVLCQRLTFQPGVIYTGLALNERGVERVANAGLNAVDASISTSDSHSRVNAGCSLSEARDMLRRMIQVGKAEGIEVRAGLQNVWGCNLEGVIPESRILDMVQEMVDAGADMISLADSTGMANPKSMKNTLEKVLPVVGEIPLELHLHDTRGLGLANVVAALEMGVTHFDTSMAGMGGCPFIPGATGNIATEDVANLMVGLGVQTGIDILSVAFCSLQMERHLEKRFPGKMHRLLERKTEESPARLPDQV